MFRKKDSQRNLFESRNLVPAAKQRRLQASWAETFRSRALPLIDDRSLRPCIAPTTGAPTSRWRRSSAFFCSRRCSL